MEKPSAHGDEFHFFRISRFGIRGLVRVPYSDNNSQLVALAEAESVKGHAGFVVRAGDEERGCGIAESVTESRLVLFSTFSRNPKRKSASEVNLMRIDEVPSRPFLVAWD